MVEYKIVSIQPLVDITPDGRFVKIYRVNFRFDNFTDYVDIPEEQYSASKVKELIEKRVKEHSELLGKS